MNKVQQLSSFVYRKRHSKMTDHVSIQIDANFDPLASSILQKIDRLHIRGEESLDCTIFRVPSHIKECDKTYYEPRMVSIGPLHRGKVHLESMEEQKLRYLHQMLTENPEITMQQYLAMLKKLEEPARRCYFESVNLNSNEFIEMLLLDGCFIIKHVMNWNFNVPDIVCEVSWSVPLIKTDLLMLENQIPFFILQSIYDLHMSRSGNPSSSSTQNNPNMQNNRTECTIHSFVDLIVKFLVSGEETLPIESSKIFHLLHLFYCCYIPSRDQLTPTSRNICFPLEILQVRRIKSYINSLSNRPIFRNLNRRAHMRAPRMIPCATELQEAGITFKKARTASLFDVSFTNGVLHMPYFPLEEVTRPRIMNLIAFEQTSCLEETPLTSYAVFMDCIINTSRDVIILQRKGIIENKLSDEAEAALFFNQLRYCSYLDYETHYLAGLFKDVKKYCDSKWQKYRARLFRDYFSNPWSIISFIGAIILLVLTVVQSIFTVLSFYEIS